VLVNGDEFLDLGPVLLATRIVFLEVDPVPDLLVDSRIQYKLFLGFAWLDLLVSRLCLRRYLHAIGIAGRVDNTTLNHLVNDGLFVLLVGFFDLFDDGGSGFRIGLSERDASFEIGIRGHGHLISLSIHIMLDPRIFLQQGKVLLHRVLAKQSQVSIKVNVLTRKCRSSSDILRSNRAPSERPGRSG